MGRDNVSASCSGHLLLPARRSTTGLKADGLHLELQSSCGGVGHEDTKSMLHAHHQSPGQGACTVSKTQAAQCLR